MTTRPSSSSEEEFAAKQLMRDMQPFHGGSKADTEWPIFWTCMSSILTLSAYSPLDGVLPNGQLVTTTRNLANSNMLYLFLVGKLRTPALDAFHNNTTYMGFGFEMLDRLRQTYAPQRQSNIYMNFLGLISLDMGPKDTLDQMVAQIRKYAMALSAGSVEVPPPLLSMTFMKSLDDRFEVLTQNFIVEPKKYIHMSIDRLHQVTNQFSTSAQCLLSTTLPRSVGSVAAAGKSNAPAPASSPGPNLINAKDIQQLTTAGNCVCGRMNHTVDRCSQFMHAGYLT
jgi:hypothetical protein